MKFSHRVYYRKLYFSFPMKQEPALREVYCALLKGEKNILVDCGVSYNHPDIVALAAEAGLGLCDIHAIIITHCHADHTGGLFQLKQEYPHIQVWTHPLGKEMVEDIDRQYKKRPVPAYYTLMGGSVPVDRVLQDGETLDLGYPVQIFHTPGHSVDSLSVYLPDDALLLSGDLIPYIHDLPIYESLDDLRSSLLKIESIPTNYYISGFGGLWDNNADGNLLKITNQRLEDVQTAVESFLSSNPDGTLEEMGKYVITQIGLKGIPIPIFLTSLSEHIKLSRV
ncbi:MAG: MBL fold metallo-hydrolase [Angelakisella sp.]|nr:MBL fold metallo-hydrolase [Angelakisella sp.]